MRSLPAFAGAALVAGCSLTMDFKQGLECAGPADCFGGHACYLGECVAQVPQACGNYVHDSGEACDDGNHTDGDGCSADCTSDESCGNGAIDAEAGEICDDGPANATYGKCSADCMRVLECGDGTVDSPNEICDDGADNGLYDQCRDDCQGMGPFCGDGNVDQPWEACEQGDGDACRPCALDCSRLTAGSVCGDGLRCLADEDCDDGDQSNNNGCVEGCVVATCGDGFECTDPLTCTSGPTGGLEECDDGDAENSDSCLTTCQAATCGDGVECTDPSTCATGPAGGAEECDDGDQENDDSCLTTCADAICGDSVECTDGGCTTGPGNGPEVCDDGVGGTCVDDCSGTEVCGNAIVDGLDVCDDGNEDNGDACSGDCLTITEFGVELNETGSTGNPAVASASDGTFVIAWHGGGASQEVYARRFDSAGLSLEDPILANNPTLRGAKPDVAIADDGSFVVTWEENNPTDSPDYEWEVVGQRFDSNGAKVGGAFRVNSHQPDNQTSPSIAMAPTGEFVIVWGSNKQDADPGTGVYGQLYDTSGATVGSEFPVNQSTTDDQGSPDVAMKQDGTFLVVWQTLHDYATKGYDIFGRWFDANGSAQADEFLIPSVGGAVNQSKPAVDLRSDGSYVVAFMAPGPSSTEDSLFRLFAANGTPLNDDTAMNDTPGENCATNGPAVAGLAQDRFVISCMWGDGPGWTILGQRYTAAGTRFGSNFVINDGPGSTGGGPSIAPLPDGGFVVAWTGVDSYSTGVRVKVYPEFESPQEVCGDGVRQAEEICDDGNTEGRDLCPSDCQTTCTWEEMGVGSAAEGGISNNASPTGQEPVIAVDGAGRPVVAWSYEVIPGGRAEIYVRRFNGTAWEEIGTGSASGGGISDNTGRSQLPSLAIDGSGNPVIAWQDDTSDHLEIYAKGWTGSAWAEVGTGSATGGGVSNTTGNSVLPSLARDSTDNLVVAWTDGTNCNYEIYVKRLVGSAWQEISTGSAAGGGVSQSCAASGGASLAFSTGGNAVLAWSDSTSGEPEVYVRILGGGVWNEMGTGSATGGGVSQTANSGGRPVIAIDTNGRSVLVWGADATGTQEIYVRGFVGTTWDEIGAGSASGGGISGVPYVSRRPSLAFSGSIPLVAWEDNASGNSEIYARMFDGTNWVEIRSGSASGGGISGSGSSISTEPSIATDNSGVPIVVWDDNSSGEWGVFVRRFECP